MRRIALLAILALGPGCRQDMHDQAKLEPLEATKLFADGRGSRLPISGTVARGQLRADPQLYRGLGADGEFTRSFPIAVDRALVERGRQRYGIFCAPCHGARGDGRGMIVRRGFPQPTSFHDRRLGEVAHGYIYDVISNGFGKMSSYAAQVPVADRWAIVAYVRALQTSQNVPVKRLADAELGQLATPPDREEER